MLPRTMVEIHVDVDYTALSEPTQRDVETGGFGTRQYAVAMILGATWEDAHAALCEERERAARIARIAVDADDFDRRAQDEEGEGLEDPLEGFVAAPDLGMHGVCLALCSAGCVTGASCRGHPGEHAWSGHPLILFTADARRTRLIEEVARGSGCGLETSAHRLRLWSPSLDEIFDLGAKLIEKQGEFHELPLPLAVRRARGLAAPGEEPYVAPGPDQLSFLS